MELQVFAGVIVDQLQGGRGSQSAARCFRFLCLNHGVRAVTVQAGLQRGGVAWKGQMRRNSLTVAVGVLVNPPQRATTRLLLRLRRRIRPAALAVWRPDPA